MAVPAAIAEAMRAAGALPMGMAGQHQPPLRLPGVDLAEAGGGEGHEQPRMPADGLGDALAALEAGGEQLVGVSPVRGGARGTAGLPAGATCLEQQPVRFPPAVVDGADLTGSPVGVFYPAGKADGVVAVAGLGDQLGPPLIAVGGPVHDLPQDAREQLAHAHRLGHAASPGAGMPGTTRSPGACSANSWVGSARSPAVARMMAATW
jgi:hypothetical protein